MMKNLILFIFLFIGLGAVAQKQNSYTNKIILKLGQKINVITTNTSDADLGMSMQMKNNSINANTITVTGENEVDFKLINTLTKLKLSIEAMGQSQNFDSEKEEDKNSEIGKALSETIGKSINVNVNKLSGNPTFEIKDAGPEKPESNPLEGLMSSFGSEDPSISGAFLLVPASTKIGGSWTVKDSTNEKKSVKTYTINNIVNNLASISFLSEINSNNIVEMSGTQMEMAIRTNSTGTLITNLKSGLVSERSVLSDISGTMNVQGQSMPITAKTNLVSHYTLIGN